MIRRIIILLLAIYLFIYVFAVPMLMLSLVPTWGTWMGGFLLILQGTLCALWLVANAGWRGAAAAAVIAGLSWGVEHLGVTTGWPFGRYDYTDVLGWKLDGSVPLPIPFAWLLVVPAAVGMALAVLRGAFGGGSDLAPRRRTILLLAPLLAVGLDLLLEPVAAYITDYWRWIDGGPYYGVPTANFIAWWTTAFVLVAATLALAGRQLRTAQVLPALPVLLYALVLIQFTLVDLAHGYWLAALIGFCMMAAIAWRLRDPLATLWREREQMRERVTGVG
jgi:bisanhydrobacterioruberin hydratase